jgi:hypothetical protein
VYCERAGPPGYSRAAVHDTTADRFGAGPVVVAEGTFPLGSAPARTLDAPVPVGVHAAPATPVRATSVARVAAGRR